MIEITGLAVDDGRLYFFGNWQLLSRFLAFATQLSCGSDGCFSF